MFHPNLSHLKGSIQRNSPDQIKYPKLSNYIKPHSASTGILEIPSEEGYLTHPKSLFNQIFNQLSQGLIIIDKNGIVKNINNSAAKFLGVNSLDILHRPFNEFFNDHFFGFSLQKGLESQNIANSSVATICSKNGNQIKVKLDFSFLNFEHDYPDFENILLLILISKVEEDEINGQTHSINNSQEMDNRNERMRELGEMASFLAHEIRNPLGGIKGFASLLQRDLKDYPEWQKMAAMVVKGADVLNRLVTNVLNYARPLKVNIKPTHAVPFLLEIQKHIQVDHNNQHVTIEFKNLLNDDPLILMDVKLIRAALLNLIVNSIQAMPNGGTLILELLKENNMVVIKVVDNGEGITTENQKKLFTPFFTTKQNGNGFGLAEVKKTIQAHHGTVEVHSEQGQGSEFSIKLPFVKGE